MVTTRSSSSPKESTAHTHTKRYRTVLLFGAPGSGKGTQGKVIAAIPGFVHTSTGDIFRTLDKTSEMGKVFHQYSSRGELVPDEFTINLWKQHMASLVDSGGFNPNTGVVVLDGAPRDVKQAELLNDCIEVVKIIYLEASDITAMVQRLRARAVKENRADDADEKVIRNRMIVYERQTRPVLDCYPAHLVARVNADQPVLNVASDVLQVLMTI